MNRDDYTPPCVGTPQEVFFPPPNNSHGADRARAICETCEIREACLEENLSVPFGIFGGHTAKERQRIRLSRPAKKKCRWCSREFVASRNQTLCSDECRYNRSLERRREWAQRINSA